MRKLLIHNFLKMKKFLLLFSLSFFLFACDKDEDDDNNSSSNTTNSEYFFQYTNSNGNVVRIVGKEDLASNSDYVIASSISVFPSQGDSVYTFGGSFASFTGAEPYSINFSRFTEAGFTGTRKEAGENFITVSSYDYADNQLEENKVSITYGTSATVESTALGSQSNSTFNVTGVTYTGTEADPSWDVTGTFECILYDADGNQTEEFTNGTFKIELIG